MSINFVVKRRQNNVRTASTFVKMAGVNVDCFKVKLNLSIDGTQKYARKRLQHEFEGGIDKNIH